MKSDTNEETTLVALKSHQAIPEPRNGVYSALSKATVHIQTLGTCQVNGQHTGHYRPVELAAFLALNGGEAQRETVEVSLFDGEATPSALCNLVTRAAQLGLPIGYSSLQRRYKLQVAAHLDVHVLQQALKNQHWLEALEVYQGPFLIRSKSAFASELRTDLENQLMQILQCSDPRLHEKLRQRLGAIPELWSTQDTHPYTSTVMERTVLRGLNLL